MSKILKFTPLLAAMLILSPTFAEYRVNMPLETTQGGRLPNGSISFGDKDNTGNETETPSNNCTFGNGTFVVYLDKPEDEFKAGDQFYWYNGTVIAWYSPSNGYTLPSGLSLGTKQTSDPDHPSDILYSLCADHPESYPPMSFPGPIDPTDPTNPNEPVDDHTGPDWTPECILNTSSNYAAIETSTGKYFFNSTTFGLNNYNSQRWFYVPENYDSNNPSSYIYFDKSEQTGDSRVAGPNPNYSYSAICRVRKMEL